MDEDYTALENELAQTVANIESTHPGYDEYRYSVDEIGHNPYELASYLSAKYHVYFREQVQDELREIFEAQYELTLTEEVEIRYRTETSTDPETGETTTEEVPYGNVQQGDDLVKGIQTWMLTPVFKIHDRAWGTVYKLCKIFLRPTFCLSLALDLPA